MNLRLSLVFLFTVFFAAVFSQRPTVEFTISGSVVDQISGQPLEAASVRMLRQRDSSMVKGVMTLPDGTFSLKSDRRGQYRIEVSYLGYKTVTKQVRLNPEKPETRLGRIIMEEDSKVLKEAVVEGKAPEVVVKEDTTEYHADSYKLQPNSMVEDLIKKLPGVEVDSEGKITAGGKAITKILVDGKEFFGEDTKVASRNIDVSIVDKLQVIDQKSEEARLTGVDDGDEEKVINLTIKKGMKKGWFGNVSAAYGSDDRFKVDGMINRFLGENQFSILGGANNINKSTFSDQGGNIFSGSSMRGARNSGSGGSGVITAGSVGANFNVGKNDRFRVGGSVLFAPSEQKEKTRTYRENYIADSTNYNNTKEESINRSRNFSTALRLEWKIDSITQINFEPTFTYNHTETDEYSQYSTTGMHQQNINSGINDNNFDMEGMAYSGKFSFSRGSLSHPGRRTSITLHYNGNSSDGVSLINSELKFGDENFPDAVTVRDSSYRQQQNEQIRKNTYRVRATHVEPLGKNYFLQLAYQYSLSRTQSERLTYTMAENGDYSAEMDSAYSDNFENTFINQRITLKMRKREKKYVYSVGMELQPSSSKSENYLDNDKSYSRNVMNYSPSVEFTYIWNKKKTLRFRYAGRTRQPSVSQLQPSKNSTNPLIIKTGNLELNPSFENNFNLRFSKYASETQQSIQAYLQYSMTLNSIVNQSTYSEDGVQTIKPVNMNGAWNASGNFMYSAPFFSKKWQISTYSSVGFSRQIGYTQGLKNISKNLTGSERLSLDYRSEWFDTGINGHYEVSNVRNSVGKQLERTTQNYSIKMTLTLYPLKNLSVGSSLAYSDKIGYSTGFDNSMYLWNAKASYSMLKKKQLTVFCEAYDLLHQKKVMSRTIGSTYLKDTETNSLTDYYLVGLSYKFNTMGGKNGKERNNRNSAKRRRFDESF